MDAVGPGRSAQERPDVRLPAARVGQSALLEVVRAAAAARACTRPLQSEVLPDGVLAQGTGRAGVRAVQTDRGRRARRVDRGRPELQTRLRGLASENAVADAHAAAVPTGCGRRSASRPVDVVPGWRLDGREQTTAGRRQSSAASSGVLAFVHQIAVGRRSGPDDGDDDGRADDRADDADDATAADDTAAADDAAAAADDDAAAADDDRRKPVVRALPTSTAAAAAAAGRHRRSRRRQAPHVSDHTGPFQGENVRAVCGQQTGRPAVVVAVGGLARSQPRGPRRAGSRRAES